MRLHLGQPLKHELVQQLIEELSVQCLGVLVAPRQHLVGVLCCLWLFRHVDALRHAALNKFENRSAV